MDHKQLKYFLALAETLHFGRASEQCHISAPTLSRQIKQLEKELNIALFIRDNRSVSLTAQGKAFVEYARSSLAQWRQFKSECQDNGQPLSGELSFYCSVTATYSFVYDLFAKFRQQYPAIELNLNTGDPALSITHVLNDKEDLAVAVKPAQLPQGTSYLPIGQSQLVIVAPIMACPLTELLSSQQSNNIQWSQLPFIMPEQGILKDRLDQFCKTQAFTPRVYAHVSGHEAMVALASLGFGVACVPEIVLAQSPFKDQVRYLSSLDLIEPIEIGLVCKTKRLTDPVVTVLWETAENLFRL
ncbi:HTH-type transcriptional activator IlvY [Pseudoalteromonas aurantia]|uniref:HTH-type transcriptional activator IlvY n=1 Tax=Pseudoalteromonas aurantia TaxID=43654 RepID=A0A5S3V6P0_9GAMM|nr:HTH-type transcriptional activator IlvY [Pseudoalteromonas aurantia]TMO62573.1 HTH-type transcriptional activator IlvY [Pseudoalteromonas aurantia]TMO66888.1 HTH-type transcriptional activator IlvY [Pseudoalteromonas aurantia]TMO76275.1 HTH-type transcriptional activator IlvY [Pseudoalteromonas aurantia]